MAAKEQTCPTCKGEGHISGLPSYLRPTCPTCKGKGRVPVKPKGKK